MAQKTHLEFVAHGLTWFGQSVEEVLAQRASGDEFLNFIDQHFDSMCSAASSSYFLIIAGAQKKIAKKRLLSIFFLNIIINQAILKLLADLFFKLILFVTFRKSPPPPPQRDAGGVPICISPKLAPTPILFS